VVDEVSAIIKEAIESVIGGNAYQVVLVDLMIYVETNYEQFKISAQQS
jgi:hypothetical protein